MEMENWSAAQAAGTPSLSMYSGWSGLGQWKMESSAGDPQPLPRRPLPGAIQPCNGAWT